MKSKEEINIMRQGGQIAHKVLNKALHRCYEGITTKSIDSLIEKLIIENQATPWFKNVDKYKHASCISINDEWIHGIPSNRKLITGDIVKIDIGVKYKGLCVDTCWTIVAQKNYKNIVHPRSTFKHENPEITKFLLTGVKALNNAINKTIKNNRIGDLSYELQVLPEKKGYSLIKEYTGHGIGYDNWEEPQIPCYGVKGAGKLINQNMTLAIEIMYSMGKPDITLSKDGWTVKTVDKSITAMFEHTVVATNKGPEILT